jgi:hypothetical protein
MWEKESGGGGGGGVLLILSHSLSNWPVNNRDCVNESL